MTKEDRVMKQKDKIVDFALKLFIKNGFKNTSLNDIIAGLKISKGTFYHYFSSKEKMFDYLIVKINNEILPKVKPIVDDEKIDALKKFNLFMNEVKKYKIFHRKTMKSLAVIIYKNENVALRQKFIDHAVASFVPLISKILEQGKKEKVFDVKYPKETAELFFYYSLSFGQVISKIIFSENFSLSKVREVSRKLKAHKEAVERILGMKEGKLNIYDSLSLRKMLENY